MTPQFCYEDLFAVGAAAFGAGKSQWDCPFLLMSSSAEKWFAGWKDAQTRAALTA